MGVVENALESQTFFPHTIFSERFFLFTSIVVKQQVLFYLYLFHRDIIYFIYFYTLSRDPGLYKRNYGCICFGRNYK